MAYAELKKSLEGTDTEDIKKKTQSLIQASMKLGEAVYKSQQKPEAKDVTKIINKPDEKDNVVDADFEDVKEKKKIKKKAPKKIVVKEMSCGKKRLL